MTTRAVTLDDVGDLNAPPGSRPWAAAIRLELHAAIRNAEATSHSIQGWIDLFNDHEGYRLLEDGRGRPFRTYEDFCCATPPYGLGYSAEAINRIVGERRDREARKAGTMRAARENPAPLNANGAKAALTNSENVKAGHAGGNSAPYRVRKLRRDHPAIAARLDAGEFKSVAAAERASRGEDPNPPRKAPSALDWLRRWWAKADRGDRQTFLNEVRHED